MTTISVILNDYGRININRVQNEEMPSEVEKTPDAISDKFIQLHLKNIY
jgi:hypothetical protein